LQLQGCADKLVDPFNISQNAGFISPWETSEPAKAAEKSAAVNVECDPRSVTVSGKRVVKFGVHHTRLT
jgi:hypothetical protein